MMWLNGDLIADASVSVLDHGFTVGDGVFETIKTISGVPFALDRHLARLNSSAFGMMLPVPNSDLVRSAVNELLTHSSYPIGRMRITWSAGAGGAGSKRPEVMEPTLVLTHHAAGQWPPTAKVVTVPWPRSERSPLVHLKTTSYAENVLALAQAQDVGADEAIFFNYQGALSEGTGSNVIVLLDGAWVTPSLSCGVLPGVTRALAIEWCGVVERCISRDDFDSAQSALLASSTRDLQPISSVDGRTLVFDSDEIGKIVNRFKEMSARDLNP